MDKLQALQKQMESVIGAGESIMPRYTKVPLDPLRIDALREKYAVGRYVLDTDYPQWGRGEVIKMSGEEIKHVLNRIEVRFGDYVRTYPLRTADNFLIIVQS